MSDETQKTSSEEPIKPVEEKKVAATAQPADTPHKKPAAKPKPAHGRPFPLLGFLALLLAVAAGALAAFDYMLWQRQAPLNASLTQGITDQAKQVTALQQSLSVTTNSLADEARQRREEQGAINTAMQEISAKLGRTTVSWRLAEVEHLLAIANDRLALDRDRRTALIALQTADSKLQVIGEPALLAVRKHISAEVIALNAVNEPDIAGMALTLGNLTESVAQLPLLDRTPPDKASEHAAEKEGTRSVKEVLLSVWEDLKTLVRVRHHDQPIEPLLAPTEEWYLRQNLSLKLEQAQLALLRGDTGLFQQSLAETGRWLTAFFDPQAPSVANLSKTLSDLGQTELNPALPDISGSLRELRAQIQRLGEQVAGAGQKGGGL